MPWGVAAAAVAAAGSYYASDKAGDASKDAANSAQRAQDRYYQSNQTNLQPYMDAGTSALAQLNYINSGDYSGFLNSPDYLATQQSGLQTLDRSAAARGALNSGGADADRIAFGANLGAQQLGAYRGSLQNLVQVGQNAAGNLAGVSNNYATNTGNIAMNNANAQADASAGQAGAVTGLLNTLLSQWGGSGGGSTRASAYQPTTGNWGSTVQAGQGSLYNFGNNSNWYNGSGW